MGNELISIIIITWNSESVIKECIDSIMKRETNFEIIIVDNVSNDRTIDIVKSYESKINIRIIENTSNMGFSKANNLGVANASGKYVLLLNPDTVLVMTGLSKLAQQLDKRIGMIGGKLLNEDYSVQSSMYKFDTPMNIFLEQFMIGKFFPANMKLKLTPYLTKHDRKSDVDWLVGAFLLLTKEDYLKIKGFSEDYFMYAEDMDIAYKIRKIGKKVVFDPEYELIHIGGKSEKQDFSSSKQEKMFKSRSLFAKKYDYKNNIKWFIACYKFKLMMIKLIGIFSDKHMEKKRNYEENLSLLISLKRG